MGDAVIEGLSAEDTKPGDDVSVAKSDDGSGGDEAEDASSKFAGKSSAHITVTDLPPKCNWSQIRKMFHGTPRIKDGKVDMKTLIAEVDFDSADVCGEAARSYKVVEFVADEGVGGPKWVVQFELPEPKDFPTKNKPMGSYGGAPIKSYGRFVIEPAFKTGSTRDEKKDYDYQSRRRDDYHDRRRRKEMEEERRREERERDRSRRDRSRSGGRDRDRSRRDRSRDRSRRDDRDRDRSRRDRSRSRDRRR